jgi:hypothetical protein
VAAIRVRPRISDVESELWGPLMLVDSAGWACTLSHGARVAERQEIREAADYCPAAFAFLGSRGALPPISVLGRARREDVSDGAAERPRQRDTRRWMGAAKPTLDAIDSSGRDAPSGGAETLTGKPLREPSPLQWHDAVGLMFDHLR